MSEAAQKFNSVENGTIENEIAGRAAPYLAMLMLHSSSLWHDTGKAIANRIGKYMSDDMRQKYDDFYDKQNKLYREEKNQKLKAIKIIRLWLDVIEDAFAYVEEHTDRTEELSKIKK